MLQQGRLPSFMMARPDERLDIMGLLKQVKKLPPLWLIHGKEDSVVCPSLVDDTLSTID